MYADFANKALSIAAGTQRQSLSSPENRKEK